MRRLTTLAQHQHRQAVDRAERIREMGRTMTQMEIAAELGITHQRVSQIARKHGIATVGHHARSVEAEANRQRFAAECQGMTAKEAAAHMGVSTAAIRAYAEATGVKVAPSAYRSPLSASTIKVLAEAPAMAADGLTKTDAARRLGISSGALTLALGRHLPDLRWRDGRRKNGGRL